MISSYNGIQPIARRIEALIQQDPGARGLGKWAIRDHLLPASRSLLQAGHVVLTTGFFIKSAGVIETDGPPGALVLASALEQLGKPVTIVADKHSQRILQRGLASVGCQAQLALFEAGEPIRSEDVLRPHTTHFIAIERPGRACDGKYYNFRGEDISPWVAAVDDLLIDCERRHIVTIGIGDGGNELGMGQVSHDVDTHVAPGRAFSCKLFTDYCLCAGVSNWGGYGKAALLSNIVGRNLLPEPRQLAGLLSAITAAGAVDGVTGRNEPTVDGLDSTWEHELYGRMYAIASDGIALC